MAPDQRGAQPPQALAAHQRPRGRLRPAAAAPRRPVAPTAAPARSFLPSTGWPLYATASMQGGSRSGRDRPLESDTILSVTAIPVSPDPICSPGQREGGRRVHPLDRWPLRRRHRTAGPPPAPSGRTPPAPARLRHHFARRADATRPDPACSFWRAVLPPCSPYRRRATARRLSALALVRLAVDPSRPLARPLRPRPPSPGHRHQTIMQP